MTELVLYSNGEPTTLYPFNPDLEWNNKYFTPDSSIHDWYKVYNPDEYQLEDIPYLTFQEYLDSLDNGRYDLFLDSVPRDTIWIATALLFNRDLSSMRGSLSYNG